MIPIQKKVLIVEDSPMMRARLIEICNSVNDLEIVGQSETSEDAIDSIDATNPDIVLLDIHLRSGNGLDVLRSIRMNNRPAVVIVLTNVPYPQYREVSLKLGADYFFNKATEFDMVATTLTSLSELGRINRTESHGIQTIERSFLQ